MKPGNETGQTTQRVKVAFTGLAIVLVLIGLASLILGAAGRNHPAPLPGVPAGISTARNVDNSGDPSEPLAELGVTPSTQSNIVAPEVAVP